VVGNARRKCEQDVVLLAQNTQSIYEHNQLSSMNNTQSSSLTKSATRLPLLTQLGKGFLGLEHSSSPELVERVKELFETLDQQIGFENSPQGEKDQLHLNMLIRAAYPEILLDLSDLIYVQHERPAVMLNFDHIKINLQRDQSIDLSSSNPEEINRVFNQLTDFIKYDPELFGNSDIVRLLSEGYSYYLYQTQNFPWDNPMEAFPENPQRPILDIATGLVGFSLIHEWPQDFPTLLLSDNDPFIIQGLRHFNGLVGKKNIEIREIDFAGNLPNEMQVGCLTVSKFLHHLQRPERQVFLRWALETLEPGGSLRILDTDLENQILNESQHQNFQEKLIPGYLESLVAIEKDFCKTLVQDCRDIGFQVSYFDFNQYHDETDAYSLEVGDNLDIHFLGFEITGEKPSTTSVEP